MDNDTIEDNYTEAQIAEMNRRARAAVNAPEPSTVAEATYRLIKAMQPGEEFTSLTLLSRLKSGTSRGAVTAFLAKNTERGLFEPTHKIGFGVISYRVIDPTKEVPLRGVATEGGASGREIPGRRVRELPTIKPGDAPSTFEQRIMWSKGDLTPLSKPSGKSIAERLLALAAESELLEGMFDARPPLKNFSDGELLAELSARQAAREKAAQEAEELRRSKRTGATRTRLAGA